MKEALFYTFLAIFAGTAFITLLGVIGKVQIHRRYLNALFAALLIELVGTVITLFATTEFFPNTNIVDLKGQIAELRTENKNIQTSNTELKNKVFSLTSEIYHLKGKTTRLQEDNTKLQRVNTAYKGKIDKYTAEITTLKTKIQVHKRLVQELINDLRKYYDHPEKVLLIVEQYKDKTELEKLERDWLDF